MQPASMPTPNPVPRYEELINSEKYVHTTYTATTGPSIHLLPPPSSMTDCKAGATCRSHAGCHNHPTHKDKCDKTSRTRRFLAPTLFTILTLGALMTIEYAGDASGVLPGWGYSASSPTPESGSSAADSVLRRAVEAVAGAATAADPNGQNGSVFIDRKYYLIVIFVGLIVVVILGIMLSAWCCKGAFRNPLCCPCYLCACCGGLACLECIGCGLCAEGFDQVAQDDF